LGFRALLLATAAVMSRKSLGVVGASLRFFAVNIDPMRSALRAALLAAGVTLVSLGQGKAQGLSGDTINATHYFPNTSSPDYVFGNQVVAPTAFFNYAGFQTVTVGATSITVEDTASGTWTSGSFNGWIITDLTASRIKGASIGPGTNMPGFNASDLSFTGNSVSLNFQGLSIVNGDEVVIDLTFAPNTISPLLSSGTPTNVVSVANGVDNFINGGGALPTNFQNLFNLSPSQLQSALMQLDGEASTDAEKGAFELMNQFMGLMLDPFVAGRIGSLNGSSIGFAPEEQASLPPDIAQAYASVFKAPPGAAPPMQQWTAWGSGFGASSTTNGNATVGSTNVTAADYGFVGGMDYHVTPSTLYGFALAGAGTNWNLSQGLGSGRSDAFQAGVYAKSYYGPAYVAGALAFANNWFTTDRTALGDQLQASFNGQSYGGRLETGYRYAAPMSGSVIGATPYAAIQTQWFRTPTYSETDLSGGGLGLTYNSTTANDTRSELGARFDDLMALNDMPLILRARLAWAHDWVTNPALDAVFQSLPGSSFVVNGAKPPADSALVSTGAELHMTANWSVAAKFDGEFAGGSQTYGGSGTLRYTW
jgi:hypothetical protein